MTRPTHPPRTTPNRLAQETSPYLLQHAHNPVDWYPWGEEALRRAQQEDKPILLSIGYSSCHWCHVMERESFADPAIAELMNRHFVNVKVDREERPDLDEIYMQATLTLNHGQGGWPMTVFLTPDQKPFFAGTYFPPQDKYGRPGFPTLLRKIAETWEQDREALTQQGEQLTEHLRRAVTPVPPRGVGEREIEAAVADLTREYDPVYGGFGGAPKFPPSGAILLLLRHYHHTGTELSKEMAENTLEKMARGGMYDQIGGGFCRYSVDERWLVPHFEKMLYDNALLLRAYLEGWQVSGRPMFARIAREICDYILREMTDAGGGFYSATDADSEGEEGKFFVWTPEEVEAHLSPEDAALVCDYYDITPQGNWEGNSIPNVPQELENVAQRHGCTPQEAWTRLMAAREVLYRVRDQRVHPGLDDKILTSWNGLMIGALAEAGRVLSDPALVAAAQRAADFIFEHMRRPDGRLFRTHRHGVSHLDAYLEDYAFLADACVDLFEAGGRPQDLERAHQLAQHMLEDFYDQSGGAFFSTSHHHEDLLLRRQDAQDGAIPSANAIAAQVLARLSYHLDAPQLRDTAASVLKSFGRMIARVPRAFVRSLLVLDFLQRGPTELAVVGRQGREAMLEEIARHYVPNRLIAVGEGEHPLLRGKAPLDQRATLYICRNYACQAPLSDPQAVEVALRQHKSEPPAVDPLGARLAGRATAEGTATLAARGPVETGYNRLGRTGLTVSRVGFGAYRVEEDEPEHRLALQEALDEGCNLIDTSSNDTAGGSESTIGEVLLERSAEGRLDRAETVVVTKIGYVQGDNLTRARELQEEGQGIPEMVPYADDCWHCIHPDYLADQLERSLARLQLQTVDVVLLHNPEYYLMHARKTGGSRDAAREELYRRLARAFAYLEAQVEQGRVAWYGVSSNTVAYAPDHPEALSLPRMLEAAQLGGGRGNHFAVLQLPLNLVEAGAVRQEHHDGVTVLELARANEMGVLVNRPLNAFAAEGLLRLGPVPEAEVEPAVPTQEALVDLEEREERLGKQLDLQVRDSDGRVLPMAALFSWGQQLRQLRGQLSGILHWRQVEAQAIRPQLLRVLRLMDASLPPEQASIWRREREGYLQALKAALAALRYEAAQQSQAQLRPLVEAVHQNVPRVRQGESLSRLALWTVMSTPGVSAVLNGMRHPQYVKDSLAVLAWDPLPEPEAVFRAVATALA